MKLIKWLVTLLIFGGIAWFAANQMSPWISINSDNPQQTYNAQITFRITVNNFSPQTKEVYFNSPETGITILIDGAPEPKPVAKADALTTVKLAPFSSQTLTHIVKLTQSNVAQNPAQILPPEATELNVSQGQHVVTATWGGHTSWQYTFGVR